MPLDDAFRWNARYQQNERFVSIGGPRAFLVENVKYLPGCGLALDVAMGLGDNAAFLMEHGLRVIGVDVSSVAVHRAKARWPELMVVLADLTQFYLPDKTFDVIMNFYYLQRELWPVYKRALRPGGILIMATLTRETLTTNPTMDPKYLLEAGELREAFADWQVLAYREGWRDTGREHPRAVASLVARLQE